MAKKKILHVVESFGSGVFSFLTDLVDETSNDFEIYIAYGKRDETPENFSDYFSSDVKFICVENFGRSISATQDFKAYKEIKQIIKNVEPDIIHLHSSKAGFIGRFAANCKKTKVLYNPHGFSFLMKNNSAFKRKIYWVIEKSAAINHATIVGCSYGEYCEALKLSKNSVCINNGINIKSMEDMTKDLPQHTFTAGKLRVCTSARISFQKQPNIWNEIAEKFPDIDFTWIGDGELKDSLTSKNITVTGWQPKQDVIKTLNDCDIFLLTSAWEGLPLSLLEAMYMKKICIVSNCIGNNDVINNGINGFVCNDVIDFVNAMKTSLSFSIDEIKAMTSVAKNDVIENYNVRKNVKEKYVSEYLK